MRGASFPVLKEDAAELFCGDYDSGWEKQTSVINPRQNTLIIIRIARCCSSSFYDSGWEKQTAVAVGDVVDFDVSCFSDLSDQICGSMGSDEDIKLIYPIAAAKTFVIIIRIARCCSSSFAAS